MYGYAIRDAGIVKDNPAKVHKTIHLREGDLTTFEMVVGTRHNRMGKTFAGVKS